MYKTSQRGEYMIFGLLLACQDSQKNESNEFGQAEFSFTEPVEIPTDLFMDAIDLDGDTFVDIILKETAGTYSWSKGDGKGEFSSQGLLWDGAIESEFFAVLENEFNTTPTNSVRIYNERLGDFDLDGMIDMVQTVQVIEASDSYWGIVLTHSILDSSQRNHEVIMVDTNNLQPRMVRGKEQSQFSIFSATGIWLYDQDQLSHLSQSNPVERFDGAIFAHDFDGDENEDFYVLHNSAFGFIEGDLYQYNNGGFTVETYVDGIPFSHDTYNNIHEFWILSSDGAYLLSDDASKWNFTFSFDAYGPSVMGDFGGDGFLDVLTRNTQELRSYFGNGQGAFTENSGSGIELGFETWVGDINQDGKDDILDPRQNTLYLYLAQ